MSKVFRNARSYSGQKLAFAIEHGRFVDVAEDIESSEFVDLNNATVLPGFIDAHCHIMPTGFDLARLHLGECQTEQDVLDAVRDKHENGDQDGWLLAVHYDQTKFESGEHLNRSQLDAISNTRPIVLRHVNGHASVVNSKALQAAKVDSSIQDPKGGTFVRDKSGELTGVLLEKAHENVADAQPKPTVEQMADAIYKAAEVMSRCGVTTASDMMTGYRDLAMELEAYRLASERGAPIRFRLYLQWTPLFGPRALKEEVRSELTSAMEADFCKVAGAKIFADGAIASATAAIHGEFTTGGNGKLIYKQDRLERMVQTAHDAGWPVSVHSIGDRSTDLVLTAFEKTDQPNRHRIEHTMILSDEQIDRLARLNCHVAMQPEFLLRLGHAYKRQLNTATASKLKRARSCLDKGIRLSFNSDRPIVAGAPWDGIRTASKRPDGFDQNENVTVEEAIDLYTNGGADANDDNGIMGEIKPGQLADFQVYDGGIEQETVSKPDAVYMHGELKK